MKTMTKALAKASVTTIAAGAMAMTSVAPAYARDRHNNGIDAGDVIAGAVILGGIAAVLSAGKDRNDYHYRDRDYRPAYNGHRGNGERAVQMCINAVERDARRAGYRFADVTQIRDVDRDRNGWEVRGRLIVDEGRTYRGDRYGYDRDRYGYDRNRYDRGNRYDRRYDDGRFTCEVRRGRIVDIDYSGIRGLR